MPLENDYDQFSMTEDHSHPSYLLGAQMALQKQYDELEDNFLKKHYPPLCQKIQFYVDKYLDSQDYNTSPIYDMYPSSATLDHMVDTIYLEAQDDSPHMMKEFEMVKNVRYVQRNTLYAIIYPLLLNELYRRRMRKYLYTLQYYPPTLGFPLF